MDAEEYLRLERAAETKSEYDNGVVYAMPSLNADHNLIVGSLMWTLRKHLPSACRVLGLQMRGGIFNPTRFFYPDVIVVCDKSELADDHERDRDASLKLPCVNVEIPLSEIYYQVDLTSPPRP